MAETWNVLWLIPLFPLVGSAACGILHFLALRARRLDPGSRGPVRLAGVIACTAVAASLAVGIAGILALLRAEEAVALVSTPWSWIGTGGFGVEVAMVLDHLSSVMVLVVCGVGLLIHVYSTGYMGGDPGYAKFFAFLNLFVFAMLVLVLSSSLLGLFVGWEGVGLCSYLLIGFWYAKGWPAEAGQKAFVVNRIGDACFLLGTFLLAGVFATLDMADIGAGVPGALAAHPTRLTLAALLLFGGACGKSAQWPLFTWLPDAMAGPTPVSALIHAATMVTAGVYLVVRLNPLFAASPGVLALIGCVGALTALIGGSSAILQRDIKKVLAYSTVSQLGYMFLALGAGAWTAAIFHLVTHAFFKGLLFLGAGSVIHGMHEEQDMLRMGGLRRHMPRTYVTFLCGAAALSGLPLLSGFFSKDEIIAHAFTRGGVFLLLWFVAVAVAAMTAYYTWRMVALTFFGRERFDTERVHPHESPAVMTVPLMVLAVLSLVGGALGLPHVLHVPHVLGSWLEPVVAPGNALLEAHPEMAASAEWLLLALGAGIALVFAHAGFRAFERGAAQDEELHRTRPRLAGFLSGAWHVDRTHNALIAQPIKLAAFVIHVLVDQLVIDGAVNRLGALARAAAERVRTLADGSVKSYALWMGTGAALLAILWMWA